MDAEVAQFLTSQMLITAAKIAAPILFCALGVGLIVSVIQVATQVQEMTLTFVPKIIATVIVLLVFGGWMLTTLIEFTHQVFIFASGV